MNPYDKISTMAGGELLKIAPCLRLQFQSLRNVDWQHRHGSSRLIAVVGRRCGDTRGHKQTRLLEFRPSLPIADRPFAPRPPRSELARMPVFIQTLDQAVNPPETQCFKNGILIRHALHPRVPAVKNE